MAYPDFDSTEPFIVDTDYSHDGLGTVLSHVQDGVERPISFNARLFLFLENENFRAIFSGMVLTELHIKICGDHGSLSQKGCRPLPYDITSHLAV